MSWNKGGQPKGTANENKRGTEISISNTKNRISAIVYNNKTELDGKNFPVGLLQNNIDEVAKKTQLTEQLKKIRHLYHK